MADQKISQLDAIVEIDNAFDSLAIVDQSAAATKKVTPSQLQTALGVPLDTDELAEGSTNLYLTTERVQDIVGAEIQGGEDITATYSDALGTVTISLDTGIDAAKIADGTVSNAEFQYIGGLTSDAQTQIDSKQATLVSGTNIKTINSESLLGSGDITISGGAAAGTSGQIQFNDSSAFGADSNLYWDNTNKRLGVGTSSPTYTLEVKDNVIASKTTSSLASYTGFVVESADARLKIGTSGASGGGGVLNADGFIKRLSFQTNTTERLSIDNSGNAGLGIGTTTASARLHIKGSGSTSATTSLLVQNSSGTTILLVKDGGADKQVVMNSAQIGSLEFLGRNIATGGGQTITMSYNPLLIGGVTIDNSAKLQVDSTVSGFLPPRMTTTQKNAISSPAAGLQVYDTDLNQMSYYNGSTWVNF